MKILKNRILWFTLYGLFITLVFLYLLFPSDIAKNRIESAANSAGVTLKMDALKPSLPFGFKMKNVSAGSGRDAGSYLQGEVLDIQFNPVGFFQKNKSVYLSGKAYSGKFSGSVGLTSFSRIYPPQEGKLKFENIDLGKFTFLKSSLGKELTGKAKGKWTHAMSSAGNMSATISLFLTKGAYPLAEPFLGLTRIDFDRGELQAKMENGTIKLEKLQISGPQLDCSLSGDIAMADDFNNSQLNLKGELVLSGRKVKMNITISGTLSNPSLRYF